MRPIDTLRGQGRVPGRRRHERNRSDTRCGRTATISAAGKSRLWPSAVVRRVTVNGNHVHLSRKEYDILRELVVHAGKVLTHRHLLRVAWGRETGIDVQYLRVYVRQIRRKIEPVPEQPQFLLTEPGVGYRLQVLE